jgi:hypothetical protein
VTAPATPAAARVVDVHYHAGPDVYRRRGSCRQAAAEYARADGWVVLKSHLTSTAAAAWEARAEGLPVSGSVVLNESAGGVDPRVVEQAVHVHGADTPARLVVHLPTLTGPAHRSSLRRELFHPSFDPEVRRGPGVCDGEGRLRPRVCEVIRAARDLPVVLATGHCTRHEAQLLVDEAARAGLPRLLLTHATHPMSGWTPEELSALRDVPGLYVEVTALTLLAGHHGPEALAAAARHHPRVVFSSDLGQPDQPTPAQWLRLSRDWFAQAGLTPTQTRALTHDNPAGLLAL